MKKLTALAVALTMLLSFAACNSEGGGTAEPAIEYVEPAAEDFGYYYDDFFDGVVISEYNGKAKDISIPAELEGYPVIAIDEGAFYECSNIKSVIIPDSVIAIGEGAFCECSSLKSITIPDGVTEIEDIAFSGCKSLESITIPDSVEYFGTAVFEGCSSLKSVKLPDGITKIGYRFFGDCTSLKSITIPIRVTKIDETTFDGCSKNLEVTYGGTTYKYDQLLEVIETEVFYHEF